MNPKTWRDVVAEYKDVDNTEYLKFIEGMSDEWVQEIIQMAVKNCAIIPLQQMALDGNMNDDNRILAAFVHILTKGRAQIFVDGICIPIGKSNES